MRSHSRPCFRKKLDEEGLVEYERYHGTRLTDSGRQTAVALRERHGLIVRFLRILGVDEKTAHTDTEGIEHHLAESTLSALRELVEKAESDPDWWASRSK